VALGACDGQASVDYAALLALVAVVFAGAGAATGLGAGVPQRVANAIRTGLCIVGGDVCRPADAAAAGLDPCITSERARGHGLTVSLFAFRLGGTGEWTVAQRSDGSVLVTRIDDMRGGIGGGLGFELGSLAVGISGSVDLRLAKGVAWELPSAAAAARFFAAIRGGEPNPLPPTWRFGDLGEEAQARAGIDGAGVELTGLEATARAASGARIGRGETTIYVDAGLALSGPADFLPVAGAANRSSSSAPNGGRAPLVLSVTRDAHGLRELAFRRVEAGARRGEAVEWVGRLDLRDPANRAVADSLLRHPLPWPPRVAEDLRAALRRTVQVGTVERSVFAVSDNSKDLAVAVRAAAEFGLDASTIDVERHLVGASAWTAGSPERQRVDCVPEEAA
jgi:hypothetical protein